ncbi:MAG TPA: hydroxyacid dehydrogenase [Casimicrobiaceae bacterium]|nr:hydroxyacid dehydrogenase [Casimicrobiaceae bacterium]
MRVLIAEFMDQAAVAYLASRHDTRYDAALGERREALLAAVADTDALIVRNRTRVDAELIGGARRLRVVGRLGVGLDNIDLPACAAREIEVIPATGANAQAVAEYVIASAFLLARGAYFATAAVAAGEWPRAALSSGRELHGKTLGVVGFGSIGRATARLARAVGMATVGHDANIPSEAEVWSAEQTRPLELDAILRETDVVSLHVPLTPSTRALIGREQLALMKPDAILINTARGGVVDEAALAAALRDGRLAGAALDVFEREPLGSRSALAGCPNLVLTPHIAGVTREANVRVSALVAEKVAEALARRAG